MANEKQGSTAADALELTVRRHEFLATLDSSPLEKRELVTNVCVSRSTVDRAIRNLEQSGFVYRTNEGYRTSLYGHWVLAVYESALDAIGRVQGARSLLSELPPGLRFDLSILADAEIHEVGRSERPPMERVIELFEDAVRIDGLAYAYASLEALLECEPSDVTDAEIVVRRESLAYLELASPNVLSALVGDERFTFYSEEYVPFGLFLVETPDATRVCFLVYGDDDLRGVVLNDDLDALLWTREVIGRYKAGATSISNRA